MPLADSRLKRGELGAIVDGELREEGRQRPIDEVDGASFTRASLFGGSVRFKRAEPDPRTETGDAQLDAAHEAIDEPGRYLVFHDSGTVRTVAMTNDSMRIGRSLWNDNPIGRTMNRNWRL